MQVDERWIEIAYGMYEGCLTGDVPSEVWNYWRTDANFVPEGGVRRPPSTTRADACAELVGTHRRSGHRRREPLSPMKAAVAWRSASASGSRGGPPVARRRVRIRIRDQCPVLFSFNEVARKRRCLSDRRRVVVPDQRCQCPIRAIVPRYDLIRAGPTLQTPTMVGKRSLRRSIPTTILLNGRPRECPACHET